MVVLFAASGLFNPLPPDFGGPASEAAAYFEDNHDGLQVGCALIAASAPFLVWFLATVAELAHSGGPAARRAGAVAYGAGLVALALFLVDVTGLALGALRPENMAASPELAAALLDVSFVAIAMAAFLMAAVFVSFAVLVLRDGLIWPRWLGWLALVAALACTLRVGTLFTTEGAFTAGGALGFWAPVIGFGAWLLIASVVLALELRRQRFHAPRAGH